MLQHRIRPKDENLEPLENPGKTSGFVSPAEDYLKGQLNILEKLIKDPVNTYYAEAASDELNALGITKGSLFVYDTSIVPKNGSLVIVWYQGEWKVRQLILLGQQVYLGTGDDTIESELVSKEELVIRGVVTWSCRPHQNNPKNHVRSR